MSTNFFSRGMIIDNSRFYMIGVKKTGSESHIPSDLDSDQSYYVLCQNQFSYNSENEQRVYWSCDLNDFVRDYSNVSLNQGPVAFSRVNVSGGFQFKYYTQKSRLITENHISNNLTVDPSTIRSDEQKNNQSFFIRQNLYNLKNYTLYYSIPYSFEKLNGIDDLTEPIYPWCFRKTTGTDVTHNSLINIFPTVTGVTTFTNKKLNTNSVLSISNLSHPNIQYDSGKEYIKVNYNSLTSEQQTTINNYPVTNGVVIITNDYLTGSPSSIFYYDNKFFSSDRSHVIFHITEKNIYGSNELADFDYSHVNTSAQNFSLLCELRNSKDNFFVINDSNNDLRKWLDIYFIPATDFAYFPDVHTLNFSNDYPIERLLPSSTYKIYAPHTKDNIVEPTLTNPNSLLFQDYFFRQFSIFFIITLMGGNTAYWKRSGYTAYPTIGKGVALRNKEEDNVRDTLFTWSRIEDAKSGFMYNYCLIGESCGNCYGNDEKGYANCYVHPETRNIAINYTTPGINTNSGSGPKPLSSSDVRYDSSIDFYVFVGLNIGFFVLLMIALIVYWSKKAKSNEITDKYELHDITQFGDSAPLEDLPPSNPETSKTTPSKTKVSETKL